jgi:hypothetical protein
LLERLVEVGGHGLSVRRLGGTRAGEIRLTRFIRNQAVSSEEMLRTAALRTSGRCAGRHVLAIQDTTVVRGETKGAGLHLHAMIAVDAADGALLGVVHGEFLLRDKGRRGLKRGLTVDDKQSRRWLTAAQRAAETCAAADRITMIADRESDIYDAFARRPPGVDLLIRAAQDRALEDGGLLFAQADALAELGRRKLELPAGPGRKARTAELAVRVARVRVKRPRNGAHTPGVAKTIEVNLVDVREVGAPAGQAPLHWRLLTTHAILNAEDGWAMAELYRRRWVIEQLFRTLKSEGFDIEGLRLGQDAPRERLVAAALVAAVIAQQLVHARDGAAPHAPQRPAQDAFEADDIPLLEAFCAKLEGKTERQKNPHPRQSLAYAAWVCARLGGWTGYYGKPGPVVMIRGWRQFQDAKAGWTLAALSEAIHNV